MPQIDLTQEVIEMILWLKLCFLKDFLLDGNRSFPQPQKAHTGAFYHPLVPTHHLFGAGTQGDGLLLARIRSPRGAPVRAAVRSVAFPLLLLLPPRPPSRGEVGVPPFREAVELREVLPARPEVVSLPHGFQQGPRAVVFPDDARARIGQDRVQDRPEGIGRRCERSGVAAAVVGRTRSSPASSSSSLLLLLLLHQGEKLVQEPEAAPSRPLPVAVPTAALSRRRCRRRRLVGPRPEDDVGVDHDALEEVGIGVVGIMSIVVVIVIVIVIAVLVLLRQHRPHDPPQEGFGPIGGIVPVPRRKAPGPEDARAGLHRHHGRLRWSRRQRVIAAVAVVVAAVLLLQHGF